MKNKSLPLVTIITVLFNLIGATLAPSPVAAAPDPKRDLFSAEISPDWFSSASGAQAPILMPPPRPAAADRPYDESNNDGFQHAIYDWPEDLGTGWIAYTYEGQGPQDPRV